MSGFVRVTVLLIFAIFILAGCNNLTASKGDEVISGPPPVPSEQEAVNYALKKGFLSEISSTRKVYLRFTEFGPAYQMVTGKNPEGQQTVIWFEKNKNEINVVNSVLLNNGISEEEARERVKKKGKPEVIFLAPMDLPPFDQKKDVAWYIQLNKKHYIWVDFKTGKIILENQYNSE